MSSHSYDIAIIGGGMSGLALLDEMITRDVSGSHSIILIELKEEYSRDKVWSFWNVKQEDYSSIILKKWDKFRLKNNEDDIVIETPYEYITIDSGKYYHQILENAKSEPSVTLKLGRIVESIDTAKSANVRIILDTGENITANQVFDSRIPENLDLGKFGMLQHFKGIEIEVDKKIFNPQIVDLMDFTTNQQWGIHFTYVLPLSEDRAIVETTWFSPTIVSDDIYDDQIMNYLQKLGIDDYTQVYEEKGVIPMTTSIKQQRRWDKIIQIGTRGGLTRPSTGYTFLFAQWHARHIVDQILSKKYRLKPLRSRWIDYLDQILLRVLTKTPELGPQIFVSLFKKNNHNRVIRFLSGNSTLRDELIMMINTPYLHLFLREAILEIFNRMKFW